MPVSQTNIALPQTQLAAYESAGSGFPILMLHGAGANAGVFSKQLDGPLGDTHRVIALDLPGHGASSPARTPQVDYTVTGLADIVAAAMDRLSLSRAIVMGWSLGGQVTMEMMQRHSGRIAGAMVSGASPVGHNPLSLLWAFQTRWDMLLAVKPEFTHYDAERFARLCYGDEISEEQIDMILRSDGRMRAHFGSSLLRRESADERQVIETSPIPLAMVNGESDPLVRRSYVEGLAYANLWDGKCHVVDGAAHVPFMTHPNIFNALLYRFAADVVTEERRRDQRVAAEVIPVPAPARIDAA
ncbi:alpha/beta hydrolase [Devosia sp. 63-57]|uniref:alpha/beta fold hydrolase n=1 Tax=Devosia sp. 63-57 TaxID=1895751 RepID=UPI000869BF08|nr:alpha/beta hydrolase [Devosia sp. 63-57]ODU85221.1 MAG: hypothetical protein ABT14_13290 [Pelagibacterium sp. SCN 63-17]